MIRTQWFTIFILCLLIIGSSAAQDASEPLILLKPRTDSVLGEGDLWEWTGGPTLRQKTQWGYNEDLRLSPLNNEIAYESWARIWVEYIEANSMTNGGRFPGNIWVITTESSDLGTRVGDQPADAALMPQGGTTNTLIRGVPIWSPDGTKLAWTEHLQIGYERPEPNRVVVYDKATQTTSTLVEALPEEFGIDKGIDGRWVGDSIVILNNPMESPVLFDVAFLVYDAETGEQRFSIFGSEFIEGNNTTPTLTVPVEHMGKTWLGLMYLLPDQPKQWYLTDIKTGEVIKLDGDLPFAVAKGHEETSIRVQVDFMSREEISYSVTDVKGEPLNLGIHSEQFVREFALSPDGQAIAYQVYGSSLGFYNDTIWVWRDGVITQAPETGDPNNVTEFVWGATTWMIESSALGQ